jgi:hypothetical protein
MRIALQMQFSVKQGITLVPINTAQLSSSGGVKLRYEKCLEFGEMPTCINMLERH